MTIRLTGYSGYLPCLFHEDVPNRQGCLDRRFRQTSASSSWVGGVRPNTDHPTALLYLARESGLVYLTYLPAPSFGTLFIFRMN